MWRRPLLQLAARKGPTRLTTARSYAAAAVQQVQPAEPVDFVRTAIERLFVEDGKAGKSDTDLLKSVHVFQGQIDEAKNCLNDCRNNEGNLNDELETAEAALEEATAALLDVIDDLRVAPEEQSGKFKLLREESVLAIKSLRHELDEIKGTA